MLNMYNTIMDMLMVNVGWVSGQVMRFELVISYPRLPTILGVMLNIMALKHGGQDKPLPTIP